MKRQTGGTEPARIMVDRMWSSVGSTNSAWAMHKAGSRRGDVDSESFIFISVNHNLVKGQTSTTRLRSHRKLLNWVQDM